jgi:hypothetical protein
VLVETKCYIDNILLLFEKAREEIKIFPIFFILLPGMLEKNIGMVYIK